jgi:hypothetical protein
VAFLEPSDIVRPNTPAFGLSEATAKRNLQNEKGKIAALMVTIHQHPYQTKKQLNKLQV